MAPTVPHHLVTQICIHHTAGPDVEKGWRKTLGDPDLHLEKLTRLEGVNLVHVWWGMRAVDPMKGEHPFVVLKAVVEAFRGKGLREARTTVFMHPHGGVKGFFREPRQGVAKEVRKLMLES